MNQLKLFSFSRDQKVGFMGERHVYEQLQDRGYVPQVDPDFQRQGFDMVIKPTEPGQRPIPVEVKFAYPTRRGMPYINRAGHKVWYTRWQWKVHETSHKQHEWVLVLVAEDEDGERHHFIIPGGAVGDRTHLKITSHPRKYNGWMKQWLERWELITYLQNGVYRDGGPLFHKWVSEVIAA